MPSGSAKVPICGNTVSYGRSATTSDEGIPASAISCSILSRPAYYVIADGHVMSVWDFQGAIAPDREVLRLHRGELAESFNDLYSRLNPGLRRRRVGPRSAGWRSRGKNRGQRRARRVPDRTVNPGNSRSLTGKRGTPLACINAGQTICTRSLPSWPRSFESHHRHPSSAL
jgi:hypothetical protein